MAAKKKRSVYELKRAKIMAGRKKKFKVTTFKPEEKSIVGRIAEFLNWAKDRYPSQILTYEEITQAIFSLGSVPRKGSRNVKSVQRQISASKRIIQDRYKTTLVTERGIGARAAVNDMDMLEGPLPLAVVRHQQTAKSLKDIANLISPERLQNQIGEVGDLKLREDLMELSKWFNDTLFKYLKSLDRPRIAAALLPPPPTE